ncbi:MAG: phosphate acyltransferase, partial [Planctomycetota bacterium]
MSEFFDKLIQRASLRPRTIVLPEGSDDRILDAAAKILELGCAKLILLGDVQSIQEALSQ